MSAVVYVDRKKFPSLDEPDKSLDVDVRSDGGVDLYIEDQWGGPYNNGSGEGLSLTARQVDELRKMLS